MGTQQHEIGPACDRKDANIFFHHVALAGALVNLKSIEPIA